MQLNRQTDYALRALIFLAMRGENTLSTIDEIANKFLIAREHLTKIISRLAKLKYIVAVRGKGGGIKLNPLVLKITLAEIVKHFEPTFNVIDCTGLACPLTKLCRLQQVLYEASNAFLTTLNQYTLKDILPKTLLQITNVNRKLGIHKKVANDG